MEFLENSNTLLLGKAVGPGQTRTKSLAETKRHNKPLPDRISQDMLGHVRTRFSSFFRVILKFDRHGVPDESHRVPMSYDVLSFPRAAANGHWSHVMFSGACTVNRCERRACRFNDEQEFFSKLLFQLH